MKSIDEAVFQSLKRFFEEWNDMPDLRLREHEAISRYVLGYLLQHVGTTLGLMQATQICIEGAVPGVNRRKSQVNRDLLIWPEDQFSTFDADWKPIHAPWVLQEWKVIRPGKGLLTYAIQADEQWLKDFTAHFEKTIGYTVVLNLREVEPVLYAKRIVEGRVQSSFQLP
ncbi:MAG: hypothetical protein H6510_15710 [Acidobacteria bacterium]|nr:hypothetical protein [Acidobacteriota bacterium]MCB9399258.1 hypothetical protein [Acidobacteriota bacterium]